MLIILTFLRALFIIELRDYNENDIYGQENIKNERKEGLFMKEFFAGRKVSLLTDGEQTGGIGIWHMDLEEKEIRHMTGKLDEGAVFLWMEQGTLTCQVNQDRVEIEEGEGLFINSRNPYRLVQCKGSRAGLYVVILEREYVEADQVIAQKYTSPVLEDEKLFSLKLDRGHAVTEVLEKLGEAAEKKEDGFELEFRCLAFELWRQLYREAKEYTPSVKKADIREKVKLSHMLEFIHTHYKEKITLAELAENAGISTGEYCRFFKKKMDRTPFEYLQAYRIEQSLPEILEKADTISNIALRHGFTGSSYFTETFKKEMGCAPGDYRKWYRGELGQCPLKGAQEPQKALEPVRKVEKPVSLRQSSMPAHLL